LISNHLVAFDVVCEQHVRFVGGRIEKRSEVERKSSVADFVYQLLVGAVPLSEVDCESSKHTWSGNRQSRRQFR